MRLQPANLKSIAMEYLFDGMILAEDIYNFDGRVLLLSRGNTLTETKISQLKGFNLNNRNISVFENTYHELLQHGLSGISTLAQEYLEERVGYTAIKEKTSEYLENIRLGDRVSHELTTSISDDMTDRLNTVDPSLILQCINTPSPIDEYLRRHSINVGLINGLMGRWLGLSQGEINELTIAGLVHDIGKTKIPNGILDAPRQLSLSEFEAMKMHTVYSYDLLHTDNLFSDKVRLAARHHHEKMNGSGYPDGLRADQISLYAKVTAVSDIYDAMVSRRSYKEANNPFLIISKLATQQFSELDMRLVQVFTQYMPAELVDKPVLLSDGSIGTIRYVIESDPAHPLVEVNGTVLQTDSDLYCQRMIFEEA